MSTNSNAINFLKMILNSIKERIDGKNILIWKFIDNKIVDSYSINDYIAEYSIEEFNAQTKKLEKLNKGYNIIDLNEEGNFIVFSKGYSKEEIEIDLYLPLHFYQGERLKNRINKVTNNKLERAKIVNKIYEYCLNDDYENMLALYGLRRTGKTVAMYHTMKRLIEENKDNIGYILLDECVSLNSLCNFIRNQSDKYKINYWFLDEITLVKEFVNDGKDLYDIIYGESKAIIAGTDSYTLSKVAEDELYDRLIFINTTNIDYKEYHELLPNETYIDFVRFGGTFSPDEFYTQEKVNKYIKTSITENLIHTLANLYERNNEYYDTLYYLIEHNEINSAIEQVIKEENKELTLKIIKDEFHIGLSQTLKNLKKDKDNPLDLTQILNKVVIKNINQEVKKRLSVNDLLKQEDLDSRTVNQILSFLKAVDVLRTYKKFEGRQRQEAYLMRLSGFRYNQINQLISVLLDDFTFISLSEENQELLKQRLVETTEGFLIEHNILNILLDLINEKSKPGQTDKFFVTQVRKEYTVENGKTQGREIDIVIINRETKEMDLYEVKRNVNFEENENRWSQWLINEEFCNDLENEILGYKIRNRYLLYLGKNEDRDLNKLKEKDETLKEFIKLPVIYMRNIEEYLLNLNYDNIWRNE